MSVDQYQRAVNGLDKEIADLEKKKAAKDKEIATLQSKIVSIEKSINKNTSQSMLNSKRKQIEFSKERIRKYGIFKGKKCKRKRGYYNKHGFDLQNC